MDKGEAYRVLARELGSWRERPYEELVALVNRPAAESVLWFGDEAVTVEISVRWANTRKAMLRIEASVCGASCWKMQRLEESVVVHPVENESRSADS